MITKHDFMFLLDDDAEYSALDPRYTTINRHHVVAVYDYPCLKKPASEVVISNGKSFIVWGTTRSVADIVAGGAGGLVLVGIES